MIGVGTAFHSLAPKGRGWGEGVTKIPYRTAEAPSSHLLQPKSDLSDFGHL
jgi:hypothetical protein